MNLPLLTLAAIIVTSALAGHVYTSNRAETKVVWECIEIPTPKNFAGDGYLIRVNGADEIVLTKDVKIGGPGWAKCPNGTWGE